MSKVSVVIPVYNVEKYIDKCLQSVINQTYKNLEIIIIDDGSTDNSGKICDEYAKKDNRIIVVHTVNQGAANAKNEGLDRISGDYFCFVDSDDYYEPIFVETMLNTINSYNCEVVQCQFGNLFLDKIEVSSECKEIRVFDSYDFMKDFSERWVDAIFCNKFFKTELLKEIRFLQHRYIDDEFFTYKLVLNAKTIVEIPDALYIYRMRKSSVTKTPIAKKKILMDQADFSTERYEYIKKYHPELKLHLLEYMITVFIQIFSNNNLDESVIKYAKNKIRKYKKDIFFGRYNVRVKIAFLKAYMKKHNGDISIDSFVGNYNNYFD